MTGGWAVPYIRDLKDGGTAIIRKFVCQGGSYIGVCAGAFFAADYIYWEGKRIEYPLDLFPGYAKGPIVEIAPWSRYKLCRINLSKKPHTIIKDEPSSMMSFYSGGPWFDIPPDSRPTFWHIMTLTIDRPCWLMNTVKGVSFWPAFTPSMKKAVTAMACIGMTK